MASVVYLASMVLMGVLALLVIADVAMRRDWHSYSPEIGRPEVGGVSGLAHNPLAWALGFFLLVGLALATVLAALSGGGTTLFVVLAGFLVVGFGMFGVYALARSRGHAAAYAAGEAVVAFGFLFMIALTAFLLTNFGA